MPDTHLRVRNWEKFQHYRDRDPPWIKLYNQLLDDYDFSRLPDATKGHLVMIWLMASRNDNKIPNDPEWVGAKISADTPVDLPLLVEGGFLVPCMEEEDASHRADWASRYIPEDVRKAVYERDEFTCCACGKKSDLEVDHIVPIRMGGTGEIDNLQILCRRCNRKKRGELQTAEQDARQMLHKQWDLRSVEGEGEGETEESRVEKDPTPHTPPAEVFLCDFELFWNRYPLKVGRKAALKAYQARRRAGAKPEDILEGLTRYLAFKAATQERHHNPATFLGPNEWWTEPWTIPEATATPEKRGNGPTECVVDAKFKRPFEPIITERVTRAASPETGNVQIELPGRDMP